MKELLGIIAGFLGGILIAGHYYRKQQLDAIDSEDRLLDAIEKTHQQALRNGVRSATAAYELRVLQEQVAELSDVVEIKAEMDDILGRFKLYGNSGTLPEAPVNRFKALGDRWSEIVSSQLELRILDHTGHISLERLLKVHLSIFPSGFPWAGELRSQHAYIVDVFGTTTRIVDLASAESRVVTTPPEKIEENLNKLFHHWNVGLAGLLKRNSAVKVSEIAHFHHEFEVVHPFADGNGRIGRKILEEQLFHCFGSKVTFRPDHCEYYKALRSFNDGNEASLVELITAELERFNVAL